MNAFAVSLVVLLGDPIPKDDDVTAGWTAFAVFIGLVLAVAFLGWSLVRQLRKAQRAKDAGVYGDEPAHPEGKNSTG
jgi:hypothetical protein